MKDIKITEVFCEILSGFALAAIIIPFLDVTHVTDVALTTEFIGKHLNGASVAGGIAISYLLGLIMDAVGLSLGELFLDIWVCRDTPSSQQTQGFFKAVQPHVLQYRDTQWAYYSMYRNLFLLLIPGGIFWSWTAWSHSGWIWGLAILAASALLELCFWRTMTALLQIYYTITKSANKSDAVDGK
jgi:hypothetical protein